MPAIRSVTLMQGEIGAEIVYDNDRTETYTKVQIAAWLDAHPSATEAELETALEDRFSSPHCDVYVHIYALSDPNLDGLPHVAFLIADTGLSVPADWWDDG